MKSSSLSFVLSLAAALSCVAGETIYAPENAPREVRFANPPASARILPIHHGRPNDLAKADAELDALRRDGFGGFVGNVGFTDYLESPEAWKTYKHVVDRAHAMGMALWLYDEKGYPSCTAGGKTLEGHPEWQARAYLIAVTNVPAGSAAQPPSPPGKPVATLRRTSSDGKTETVYVITDDYIREGTHVSVSVSTYKYAYPNLLMAEPTARFIALTHDAYKRELGPSLKAITSTFTDEPSLMTSWMKSMPYFCLPVSDELIAAYAKTVGHPLADDVPELISGAAEGRVAATRHRYWTMVGDRVAENYTRQLTKWADANGVESGGHLLGEEGLVGHVCLYGDFFKVLRGLSAPSCDMLTSIPPRVNWLTPLLVGSAGELNGSRHVMSEASDHSEKYRREGDTRPIYQVSVREIVGSLNRQIWGGVNTFTSYYRWGPFDRAERVAINEEIGRTITLTREGHSAADIALLYPADALKVGFEPQLRGAGGISAIRTANFVNTAGRALFSANRSFMIVDTESLEQAKVEAGMLAKGALRWRTVVLPGVNTLPIETARRLEEFRRAGGLVIALGDRPRNSCTAFPDAEIARLAADWVYLPDTRAALLVDLLDVRHEPALRRVRGEDGALRTAHRRTKSGDVFFVMNDTGDTWSGAVRLAGGVAARVWNPRVGLSTSAAGDIALELPPFGGVVLTTESPVDGHLAPNAAISLATTFAPITEKPVAVSLGKGRYVTGGEKPLADGWRRVDVSLTQGGVDTFAFLGREYARSPFAPGAKGVAFTVRVPETTGGGAKCGVFLVTRDRLQWYAQGHVSLSEKGEREVVCAFSDFFLHGAPKQGRPARFKPADVVRINFGFGGYYGKEGEHVAFEVSAPRAFLLAKPAAKAETPDWRPPRRWRGFNLLGMFRAPTIGLAPDPRVDGHFVEWEFRAMKDWGFNFARLPIDYRILVKGDSWTNLDEAKMKHVDDAIAWGRKHGIHVQVALHRIPGYCILDQTEAFPLGTSPEAQQAACVLWSAFARRWKGIPNEELSFNLFNEPTRHTAGANYPPLALRLIEAIRREDPARFIMIDGNECASKPVPEVYGIPAVGQAFRGYTPHAITHYASGYIKTPAEPPTWPLQPNYGDSWIRRSPEATVELYRSALDAGECCMVGEFGCRNMTPHPVTLAWMEHCLKLWKANDLGWALWNLRGHNGVLDSGRSDVEYEDFNGHKLDRKMLELLRRY